MNEQEIHIEGFATISAAGGTIVCDAQPASIIIDQPTKASETWSFRLDFVPVTVHPGNLVMSAKVCNLAFRGSNGEHYTALVRAEGYLNKEVNFLVVGALGGFPSQANEVDNL